MIEKKIKQIIKKRQNQILYSSNRSYKIMMEKHNKKNQTD